MSLVTGNTDPFEGIYVTGWAIAEADPDNCNILLVDEFGQKIAAGRASLPRPDLASLGYGRTNFAFRLPVTSCVTPTKLHILANDVELPGSPVYAGPGIFDGALNVRGGIIEGWVTERVAHFTPPLVDIVDADGKRIGRVQSHTDPTAQDPHFVPARFVLDLPASCFGRSEAMLHGYVGDFRFASFRFSARLDGYVDAIGSDRCAGWLVCPDAPKRRLDLEIWRDGIKVGAGKANLFRGDLAETSELLDVGFDITLSPADPKLDLMSTMSIRLAGANDELFGGPFVAGRRPALLAAAQRAAHAAHQLASTAPAEAALLQAALNQFITSQRRGPDYSHVRAIRPAPSATPRLNIIIPIYRNIALTHACIESAMAWRNAETDRLVLINDASPEPNMAGMLAGFAREPNVVLLSNAQNLGFIRSVNRGFEFCSTGDVILLNSDTCLFAGGIDELWRIAHSAPEIGTVTAMSNNATIFSYPHPALATAGLADIGWAELAAVALEANRGSFIDVPTAHGFCMLIKRGLLDRVGKFNEIFGRGYGEENEFCQRAADLGYRHVAAAGVLVEHRESVSFGADKEALLKVNLPKLESLYPEYTPTIMGYEARDGMRKARWALDAHRLKRAVAAGTRFALVLQNSFIGGTKKAIADIAASGVYGGAEPLNVSNLASGMIELASPSLSLRAVFLPDEAADLFALLAAAEPDTIIVHQFLGFDERFLTLLADRLTTRPSIIYLHDFYPICPRVTMIDAIGEFCGMADSTVCTRCVALGGAHEGSKLTALEPAAHRSLFGHVLGAAGRVIAPSADTARRYQAMFPHLTTIKAVPHPNLDGAFPQAVRAGTWHDIALLGAIGPHKGSQTLLAMAKRALFTHPHLRFHVIGYTDIDAALTKLGNVTISGAYQAPDLPRLLDKAQAKIALFLHGWPETFSYTLSEAVMNGLIPIVPDIGAPAQRVQQAGFGLVLPFPIDVASWLTMITATDWPGFSGSPAGFNDPQTNS